ncbi:MAG: hypothetical protein ACRDKJ_05195 [Actinomycetota bacterium]
MNTSETAAGRPIEPDEAMKQIAYIRDVLDSTKQRVATYWPIFVMWGPLWVLGYAGEYWEDNSGPAWLTWRWAILNGIGSVGTFLLVSQRRGRRPLTSLERQMLWLQVGVAFSFFFGIPMAIGETILVDWNTYVPFYIGFTYFVAGVFLGRELILISLWLAACALTAEFLPEDVRWLWFAVNGGGGLTVSGLILRRQLRRS